MSLSRNKVEIENLTENEIKKIADEDEEENSDTLNPSDRKSIFQKLQTGNLFLILKAIAESQRSANPIANFEELCDQSPAFMSDYKTLILFDNIKNIKKKADAVRLVVQQYANLVLMANKLNDENNLHQVFLKLKNALGKEAMKDLFSKIKNSNVFPTSIEYMENINQEEVKNAVRAIDLYLHLPKGVSAPFVNAFINLIEKEIKSIDSLGQEKFQAHKPSSKEENNNSRYATPKPKQDTFLPFFMEIRNQQDQRKFEFNWMKNTKMQSLNHNQTSRCELFYHIAIGSELAKIQEVLSETPNAILIKDQDENSALHLAVLSGKTAIVQLLLNKGFVPYQKDIHGNTALHLAVLGENEDIVKCLVIEPGVDVHERNERGYDSLLLAMFNPCQKIASPLIRSPTFNFNQKY